jgi:hypothetical protein
MIERRRGLMLLVAAVGFMGSMMTGVHAEASADLYAIQCSKVGPL